jgi:hypothetical protein
MIALFAIPDETEAGFGGLAHFWRTKQSFALPGWPAMF